MNINHELGFSLKIDDNINYKNANELIELFDEGLSISSKSVFRLIEEIVLAGSNIRSKDALLALSGMNEKFEHPLKDLIFLVARRKILGYTLSPLKAMLAIERIKHYRYQTSCLNIVCFSCKRNRTIHRVEKLYHEIIKAWEYD